MNWFNLVPYRIAEKQSTWEKAQRVARAHDLGASYTEIAVRLGTTRQYVQQIAQRYNRPSPINDWLEDHEEVYSIYRKLTIDLMRRRLVKVSRLLKIYKPSYRRHKKTIRIDTTKIESLSK